MYDAWQAIRYTELKEKSHVCCDKSRRNLEDLRLSLSKRLKALLYTGRF